MSNHSPRVYLNDSNMDPIGSVRDSTGLLRLAVTSGTASASSGSATVDAFGRSRVSTPAGIFDSKQIFDNQPLLFSEHTANGAGISYSSAKAASTLTTTTTLNSRALRQTKRYLNYQPGKSQLILVTFNLNGIGDGVTKRVGYFDDDNGIFLQLNSTGYSIVRRTKTSGVVQDFPEPQTAWNLDPLNGSGASGRTLDPTKVIILAIDLEWLGVGSVRVGFDFGGELVYAHRFNASNVGTEVYMSTPNLPVRWEIETTGAGATNRTMDSICCSVQSEGGLNPLAVQRTISRGVVGATVDTTPRSVMSIRLKSAYNRATVFPLNSSAVTTDTGVNYFGQLLLNPTLGGALTWNDVTNSPIQSSITVTTATGGTVLSEFYGISGAPGKSGAASITTTADLNSVLALASDYAGTADILTLAIRTFAGSSASSFYAQMDWLELL